MGVDFKNLAHFGKMLIPSSTYVHTTYYYLSSQFCDNKETSVYNLGSQGRRKWGQWGHKLPPPTPFSFNIEKRTEQAIENLLLLYPKVSGHSAVPGSMLKTYKQTKNARWVFILFVRAFLFLRPVFLRDFLKSSDCNT